MSRLVLTADEGCDAEEKLRAVTQVASQVALDAENQVVAVEVNACAEVEHDGEHRCMKRHAAGELKRKDVMATPAAGDWSTQHGGELPIDETLCMCHLKCTWTQAHFRRCHTSI